MGWFQIHSNPFQVQADGKKTYTFSADTASERTAVVEALNALLSQAVNEDKKRKDFPDNFFPITEGQDVHLMTDLEEKSTR